MYDLYGTMYDQYHTKMYDLYGTMYDQSMINLVGKPG